VCLFLQTAGGAAKKGDYSEDEAGPAAKKPKADPADGAIRFDIVRQRGKLTRFAFLFLGGADFDHPGLKQVKDWRHKLQKVFLGKTPPAAEVSRGVV
jgi:hypothetical protein